MPSRSLRAVVAEARTALEGAGVPSPESDAVSLAAHALGVGAAEVHRLMVLGARADPAVLDRYAALVEERAARIPLQHLTGQGHFRRLTLDVGPGVFLPRPETEVVAGLAIDAARTVLASGNRPVVVDLCAGSGAIAFAVKDEVPEADVIGVEVSAHALAWAQRSRERLGLAVDLVCADARSALPGREGGVDVVVSNPPYIPVGAVPVDVEVHVHDPEIALYGGSEDGLAIPVAVADRAAGLLRPGGVLVMEHADSQGPALLAALARTARWTGLVDHLDLTGRPRALVARRTGPREAPVPGILLAP